MLDGTVVKDFADRCYVVRDNCLYTAMGKFYKGLDRETIKDLQLRKINKTEKELIEDWSPAGKLIREKRHKNR